MKENTCQTKSESRPDVVRIRKVYDIVLCTVLAIMFVLGPVYLYFAVYYPQWLF